MRVNELIETLKMFGEDTQVYIQTTPDDLAQPVQKHLIKLWPALHCERYGLQHAKIVLTAFIPHK